MPPFLMATSESPRVGPHVDCQGVPNMVYREQRPPHAQCKRVRDEYVTE